MPYTRQLIDLFPDRIRDRIDQDEDTLIAHFANAIQPGLDRAIDVIEDEPDFYDPDICPVELLDWLGQLVGLARAGNNYLGLGINPNWTNQQKRTAINKVWQYWQIKGTPLGVAEAISIWLDWTPNGKNVLEINKPFGSKAAHTPPQWAGWNQPYYQELLQPYRQVRRWGGGDIPGGSHLTNYAYLPPVGTEFALEGFVTIPVIPGSETLVANINSGSPIPDATITAGVQRLARRLTIRSIGAANSSNRPWMNFLLEQADWNKISPDIAELNSEIWNARTDAEPFTWLQLTPSLPLQLTGSRPLSVFASKSNWQLAVITGEDAYLVNPIISYLLDTAGVAKFTEPQSSSTQYLEFAFTPIRKAQVRRIQLTFLGTPVLNFVSTKPLQLDPLIRFGAIAKVSASVGDLPVVGVVLLPTAGVP
jgi:Phage tail protein (Tail_P2_I)